jgi:hypothetical protein
MEIPIIAINNCTHAITCGNATYLRNALFVSDCLITCANVSFQIQFLYYLSNGNAVYLFLTTELHGVLAQSYEKKLQNVEQDALVRALRGTIHSTTFNKDTRRAIAKNSLYGLLLFLAAGKILKMLVEILIWPLDSI